MACTMLSISFVKWAVDIDCEIVLLNPQPYAQSLNMISIYFLTFQEPQMTLFFLHQNASIVPDVFTVLYTTKKKILRDC